MVCCYWLYIKSSPIQLIYYLISVNRTKNELFSYILIVWLELKGTVGSLTEWGPILMKISVVLVPCLNLLPRWNVLKKFKFTSLKKNQILWFWKKILKSKLFKNVRLFSIADPWCIYIDLWDAHAIQFFGCSPSTFLSRVISGCLFPWDQLITCWDEIDWG